MKPLTSWSAPLRGVATTADRLVAGDRIRAAGLRRPIVTSATPLADRCTIVCTDDGRTRIYLTGDPVVVVGHVPQDGAA